MNATKCYYVSNKFLKYFQINRNQKNEALGNSARLSLLHSALGLQATALPVPLARIPVLREL